MEIDMIRMMHRKFGINYGGIPRPLEKDEYIFRCIAMQEELLEYIHSIFNIEDKSTIKETVDEIKAHLETLELRTNMDLSEQFDALVDLSVFLRGACERQGFPYDEGWEEVMEANMRKELATSASQSKRGFKRDLIKPADWFPPNMKQFTYPSGLIILDGPDATGKSYLAEKLATRFNGTVFHHTWSKEIDETIPSYFGTTLARCIEVVELGGLAIIDRLYLSEQIYSKVFRNNAEKWEQEMVNISIMVKQMNAIEIICLPYDKERFLNFFNSMVKQRSEMYGSMSEVYDEYLTRGYEDPDDPFIRYDMWYDGDVDHIDKFVERIGAKLWNVNTGISNFEVNGS